MEINVTLEKDNSTKKVQFKGKLLKEFLQQLKLNSEAIIITRNNEVLTEEEPLKNKDKLIVLSVVSGG
ncbi:MAG: MoaD/ThiS family protein [Candidatus Woesearchaeota archaeon]